MSEIQESEVRRLVREAVERALKREPAREAEAVRPSVGGARRVAIGSDHGGYALKKVLRRFIVEELGWEVHDCGTHSTEAVDYPDYAAAGAREVAAGACRRGGEGGGPGGAPRPGGGKMTGTPRGGRP